MTDRLTERVTCACMSAGRLTRYVTTELPSGGLVIFAVRVLCTEAHSIVW